MWRGCRQATIMTTMVGPRHPKKVRIMTQSGPPSGEQGQGRSMGRKLLQRLGHSSWQGVSALVAIVGLLISIGIVQRGSGDESKDTEGRSESQAPPSLKPGVSPSSRPGETSSTADGKSTSTLAATQLPSGRSEAEAATFGLRLPRDVDCAYSKEFVWIDVDDRVVDDESDADKEEADLAYGADCADGSGLWGRPSTYLGIPVSKNPTKPECVESARSRAADYPTTPDQLRLGFVLCLVTNRGSVARMKVTKVDWVSRNDYLPALSLDVTLWQGDI